MKPQSETTAARDVPPPLLVDQYPSGWAVPPRPRPIACEGTVFRAPGDELWCSYYDVPGKTRRTGGDTGGGIYFNYQTPANSGRTFFDTGLEYPLLLVRKVSRDGGETWGDPSPLLDQRGQPIFGAHQTFLRLRSGKIAIVYATTDVPEGRTGREGGMLFRVSDDDGRTWSDPTIVERRFGICCTGHAIVLKGGRIVVPMFKWISSDPTSGAEPSNAPSLSYSYACVSDDDGKTWTQSLSELFVSHYRAAHDLEEPAVIELRDGRLLMHLRSQLGRGYRSYSQDGGISWTRPEPLPLASAFTPFCLKRIPSTGHLLTIWNQISRQEIFSGLERHRLSCAVSDDEGETWKNFKNLESLDDIAVVKPPPLDRIEVMERWESSDYQQPGDTQRYKHAPGVLRIGYPDVVFFDDKALVVYDHGFGTLGAQGGIKQRIIPVEWFVNA